eukprot:TRINITY_DN36527_c0_g1_i2.p1 TRINITY_DN36527_c0_g1~~TRINITY_DN36527_c0_g1_i2.p1  ORF type:complete len:755 (+),score=103.81 TRINITY_DN36527_c0_g1_i2:58-2322(+)
MGNKMSSWTGYGSERPEADLAFLAQHAPQWEWLGDDGVFNAYDATTSLELERTYIAAAAGTRPGHTTVKLGKASVTVDVLQMLQYKGRNAVGTSKRMRRITQDEIARGLADTTWVPQEEDVMMDEVTEAHIEAALVRERFFGPGGLSKNEWSLASVHRIQNRPLREAYHFERQNMLRERVGVKIEESLMAFGTRTSDPAAIVQDRDGFMVEKGTEGAFYGQGCYFAENLRYSHHYSYCQDKSENVRQLLLVDLLCGQVYDMGEQLDRGGLKCNRAWLRDNGYDSVRGGPHRPKLRGPGDDDSFIRVVYRPNQAYPRFLVTYKRLVPQQLLSESPLEVEAEPSAASPATPSTVVRRALSRGRAASLSTAPRSPRFSPVRRSTTPSATPRSSPVRRGSSPSSVASNSPATGASLASHARSAGLPQTSADSRRPPRSSGSVKAAFKSRDVAIKFTPAHGDVVLSLAWNPNGHELASACGDCKLRILEAAAGNMRTEADTKQPVLCVAWMGDRLAIGLKSRKLLVARVTTGKEVLSDIVFAAEHGDSVCSVAWAPNGEELVTGCQDGRLRLFAARDGGLLWTIEHACPILCVAWSPLGDRIAFGGSNGRLIIATTMGEVERTIDHGNWLTSVAWSCCGQRLATGCDDGKLRIVTAGTGRIERAIEHEERVWSVMWHPDDGNLLATGSNDGKLRILNPSRGSVEYNSRGDKAVTSVAWSPCGSQLAAGCDGGGLRILSFGVFRVSDSGSTSERRVTTKD